MTSNIEPPLSVKKIERIERDIRLGRRSRGRYHDKDGLYLRTHESGKMSWLLRYMRKGRERWMGLGKFATFNLDEARGEAKRHRQTLQQGLDPIEVNRKDKAANPETPPIPVAGTTFEKAARDYFK